MTGKTYKVYRAAQCMGMAALVVGFMGVAASIAGAQQSSDVTVTRGLEVETSKGVSTDTRKRVTVFRGQPTFTAQDLSPKADTPSQRLEPMAGYNGWFIDHENQQIVNCFRVNTTQVGQRRIKCIAKRL